MTRLQSAAAAAALAVVLAVPISSASAAQPVSLQTWCLAPGNVVNIKFGWPPSWSPAQVDTFGYAVGVGDVVHRPAGNPVTVKGSTYSWTWVTSWPSAVHFLSVHLTGRAIKAGGPQQTFTFTTQGTLRAC